MKLAKRQWYLVLFPLVIAILVYGGLTFMIPKAEPLLKPTVSTQKETNQKEKLHYVAIGDSLTEGVGDQTKQGGFVPLVANDLKDRYDLTAVEIENYGVNGERSDQILKRVKKNEEIKKNIASADVITLTVGGNDLMKVIQNNLFGISIRSFDKPIKNYQKNVTSLIEEIRSLNQHVPIYILGIYNPFYLNFPEITDMQTIVDNWNEGTQTVVDREDNCYFIPINDLLYQGLNQEVGITAGTDQTNTSSSSSGTKNNVLYEEDHFHPNNLGYQLMANAVRDQLIETQEKWLIKEEN
ncbi:GDSL-like lipase/acylhydrolase [Enterococcus sp. 10A9_DIV0425]|uniref:GDSL-like lipase/acylhydrolase n=1 Tax=Candidatus Enterococcus wittei TaxID=1987383 RepID=A0A2C9XQZ3_9ENTE|nr:SGNH/GDSL hydrolase family protein [Enterococcus sp. 10A9_DIV0425]OTP12137.1 GDSL-like lipase/acylhydrolase [Enterococcus sp. 10A9_DIV0425]THE16113.1 lipase [Enterococcus hirae]